MNYFAIQKPGLLHLLNNTQRRSYSLNCRAANFSAFFRLATSETLSAVQSNKIFSSNRLIPTCDWFKIILLRYWDWSSTLETTCGQLNSSMLKLCRILPTYLFIQFASIVYFSFWVAFHSHFQMLFDQ